MVTSEGWKTDHTSGYASGTAPAFTPEYTSEKDFEMSDDPARNILGGDWQIPTKAIWQALVNNSSSNGWDNSKKGYTFTNNSQTLFLPAAGYVFRTWFYNVGSYGLYWSGTLYSSTAAYVLCFNSGNVNDQYKDNRHYGFSVRPVRLVEVSWAGSVPATKEGYGVEDDLKW